MSRPTQFQEVLSFSPPLEESATGSSYRGFDGRGFAQLTGRTIDFVQENHSGSQHQVLRGLHYQLVQPQGKLIRVVAGALFDVVVDVRRSSPTFGLWSGLEMSAENRLQRWVPEGFAHGFVVTSAAAQLVYLTTAYWAPEHERTILWNDPAIGIDWPLAGPPLLSGKDQAGKLLAEAEVFA